MTQPLDFGWVFLYNSIVHSNQMKKFKNPFGDLFSSIRNNSDAIMRIQLNQIQNQFTKLSRAGRHHDALALAAEYEEWILDNDEWGFLYLNNLSDELNQLN